MDAELKRKRLATSIVEYLDKAISENLVSSDGAESLEVAKQCIVDAFELDETSTELSIKPITLDRVFDVYLSTQDKLSSTKKADAAAPAAPTGPSEDDKKRAEALKAEGNALVVQKSFPAAIAKYTEAIAIVDDNAVYYGNRAAAHSQTGDHASAVADAKKALEVDPAYSKGYSRLGLAYYGLGEYKEAVEAYTKGLELDPGNRFMQDSLAAAKGKLSEDDAVETVERSTGGAGASGAGGAGGFDMASLMSNPALMGMAQNMMANGGLERLMSNPAISRMAESYRNNGQMPSMSEMMSNPDIMNMAREFGGAGGAGAGAEAGAGPGAGAGAGGANPLAGLMNNPDLMNMAQQFMGGGANRNNNTQ